MVQPGGSPTIGTGEEPSAPGTKVPPKIKQNPRRFLPQCFLLDFLSDYASTNVPFPYANFTRMLGNPSTGINRLLGKPSNAPLNKLTPAQFSSLVPKCRLFKVYADGSEEEFRFDDYTRVEDITAANLWRGAAAGLQSFSWEDLGTNLANTGLTFKAEMKILFQNLESMFRSNRGPPFSTLLQPPGAGKSQKGKDVYRMEEHRVKAIVGWTIPAIVNKAQIFGAAGKEIEAALRDSSISLFLNLTGHEISIKESGGIELTVNYIASIDAQMLSADSDLFYSQFDQKDAEMKALLKKQKKDLAALKKTEEQLVNNQGGKSFFKSDSDALNKIEDVEMPALQKKIEASEEAIAEMSSTDLSVSWSRVMNGVLMNRRLFYIELTSDDIKLIRKLNDVYSNDTLSQAEMLQERAQIVAQFSKEVGVMKVGSPPTTVTDSEVVVDIAKEKDKDDRKELIATAGENVKESADKAKAFNDNRINFFFLGDILQTAFKIIYDKPDTAIDMRFIVGNIDMWVPELEMFVGVNLADIPICWELWESFFMKKVISRQRPKYNLKAFINDVISELVLASLSPACFGKLFKQVRTRLNITNFSTPGKPIDRGQKTYHVENLPKVEWGGANFRESKDWSHYLYIYSSGLSSATLMGDREQDEKRGIFHLTIGADRGLLKTVDFKRQDIPGQRETNISKAAKAEEGNLLFSDRYNADLTLFGNTLFKPGMMAYIDPKALGVGNPSNPNSFARRLGVGGYYRVIKVDNIIEAGKFETNLQTAMESLGNTKPERGERAGERIQTDEKGAPVRNNNPNDKRIDDVPKPFDSRTDAEIARAKRASEPVDLGGAAPPPKEEKKEEGLREALFKNAPK